MCHRLLYKQKEGAIVPKKYTKTEDGWTRVEEVDEIEEIEREFSSAPSDEVLAKNNYYNKFKSSKNEDEHIYTDEDLDAIIAEYQTSRMPALTRERHVSTQSKPQKSSTQAISKQSAASTYYEDLDREATRDALIAVAWIFGIMVLIFGGLALFVELSPTLTWQGIGEWIVITTVKVFYYIIKFFFDMCYKFFDWIFFDVFNASF